MKAWQRVNGVLVCALFGAVIGGFSWTATSASAELRTHNVSACEVHGNSASNTHYWGGGTSILNQASNASGDTLTVVCPLTRTEHEYKYLDEVEIWVVDTHNTQDLSCVRTEWYVNGSGNSVYTTDSKTTTSRNSNSWTSLAWDETSASSFGANELSMQYGIYCVIPAEDTGGNESKIGTVSTWEFP